MEFCALLWRSMKRRKEAAGWRKRKEWEEEVEEKDYGYLQSLWHHPFIQDLFITPGPYHCLLSLLPPS